MGPMEDPAATRSGWRVRNCGSGRSTSPRLASCLVLMPASQVPSPGPVSCWLPEGLALAGCVALMDTMKPSFNSAGGHS